MNSHSFTCEAILQFPALAKADGLIKSKEDLMAVLQKKRHLLDKGKMATLLSTCDLIQLFVTSVPPQRLSRKQRIDE
jgi:hypothetical protein